MKKLLSLLFMLCVFQIKAQVFTKVDSIKLSNANIWGVLFDAGDSLGITTIQSINGKPHIYLRKADYANISQQSSLTQLTFDSDFIGLTNLTDHKSIILNNEIYVSFSTIGDQDLFLFKTDINGNRIGNIVTVVSRSTDPTNDMILTTDGTSIYVLYFNPISQHHVYQFDTNLNQIGSEFITKTNGHNNIGNAIFKDNQFHLFTGNLFGINASLLHTVWDNNWQPVSSDIILQSVNNEGNWFSTGLVYDTINNRWYIGQSHLYSGQTVGQEHIDLLAFDTSFNLLERIHVTPNGYYRPHLTLKNGFLYLTYDSPGPGVFLIKYQISGTLGVDDNKIFANKVRFYPNPANNVIKIAASDDLNIQTIELYNLLGERVYRKNYQSNQLISISKYGSGIYLLKLTDDRGRTLIKKLIIE